MKPLILLICSFGILAATAIDHAQVQAQTPAPSEPPKADRWEAEIRKFEEQDAKSPAPPGGNLFIGSSSVRLWKLDAAFPERPCLNRGFGGSQMVDSAKYVDRIIVPRRPIVVVVYAGDNDLNAGKTPEAIRDDYRALRDRVHAALPETRIVLISIKPSPSRWKLRDKAVAANALLRAEAESGKNQVFVDVWTPMLGESGEPKPSLFLKDMLHMNDSGYALWNERVAPHLVDAAPR